MKIFLTGFMGCGKSTLGRKLANRLGFAFIDLDKLIESQTGMSIGAYFDRFGEPAFRIMERDTLRGANFPENCVIATGGGLPCFFDNMAWMNQHGRTAYISLPPKVLADRLKHGQEERPLIRNFNEEELIAFITTKLAERDVFYTKASHILNGIDLTAQRVIAYLGLGTGQAGEIQASE